MPTSRQFHSARVLALLATLGLLAALIAIGVPYVVLSPGPMYNTLGSEDGKALVTISGTSTYPTAGELDLLTVSERGGPYGGLTLPEAFIGWADKDRLVVPVDVIYPPGATKQQVQQENATEFTSSQSAATAAAMHYLKEPVTSAVRVAAVADGAPAKDVLQVGDVLVSVNGKAVENQTQVVTQLRALKPGTAVPMTIKRDDKTQDVTVTLGASPSNPNWGYAGISLDTVYSGPFSVTFGLSDVGGPSAGMMFSLAIVDKLTPDNLNGGKSVAGTGTISPDGKVGAIGGIAQKMAAARDHHSQLFLAPADNCDEVLEAGTTGLDVAKVSTLTEAIDVLTKWRNGSEQLPRCS